MFEQEMRGALEALLFVTRDPVPLGELAEVLCLEEEEVARLLQQICAEYDRDQRGWQLTEVAGGWQLATRPQFSAYVERLLKAPQGGLSQASIETLAIIAYKQPITRLEIEEIRGVSVTHALTNLLNKNLIQEVGRKEGVGRPILYGTTDLFLKHFGLVGLHDLPQLDEIFDQEQLRLALMQEEAADGEDEENGDEDNT